MKPRKEPQRTGKGSQPTGILHHFRALPIGIFTVNVLSVAEGGAFVQTRKENTTTMMKELGVDGMGLF